MTVVGYYVQAPVSIRRRQTPPAFLFGWLVRRTRLRARFDSIGDHRMAGMAGVASRVHPIFCGTDRPAAG